MAARSLARAEAAYSAAPGFAERVLSVALDVTEESQATAAVDEAIARFGRIDVLVNNAGRGLLGAVEEALAGPDAIAMVEDKLAHVREELDEWRSLGSSTLFTTGSEAKSA